MGSKQTKSPKKRASHCCNLPASSRAPLGGSEYPISPTIFLNISLFPCMLSPFYPRILQYISLIPFISSRIIPFFFLEIPPYPLYPNGPSRKCGSKYTNQKCEEGFAKPTDSIFPCFTEKKFRPRLFTAGLHLSNCLLQFETFGKQKSK